MTESSVGVVKEELNDVVRGRPERRWVKNGERLDRRTENGLFKKILLDGFVPYGDIFTRYPTTRGGLFDSTD